MLQTMLMIQTFVLLVGLLLVQRKENRNAIADQQPWYQSISYDTQTSNSRFNIKSKVPRNEYL